MSPSSPDEILTALRDFVTRLDALDPQAPLLGDAEVTVDERRLRLPLRAPVAGALVEALRAYHDPRDRGCCEHCGGRRIDDNFMCRDCARPNGLFGRMVAERAARYAESPVVTDIPHQW